MTLFSKLREGIHSMWPASGPQKLASEAAEAAAMEQFRKLMLGLIEGDTSERGALLHLRIRCAATVQSLWFMRSELMVLLAARYGEAEARHRLDQISACVREVLPSGLRSRPSPLGRED